MSLTGLAVIHISHERDDWSHTRNLHVENYLAAARVPASLPEQTFGLWTIKRVTVTDAIQAFSLGYRSYTLLHRVSMKTLHLGPPGEVVMEDSRSELKRHLPIWMAAKGRVLISGLGLGCVVRGLLIKPEVTHIDVVEMDPDIMRICGAEFVGNPRVTLHLGDALTYPWPDDVTWDFASHDCWTDDERLQLLHGKLFHRFLNRVPRQHAWGFPREIMKLFKRGPNRHHFL